ncbi:MAG: peptidoglycan bridge formation glycyltransferase FemA/FemB family protein [Candidatus Kuenenbacteria bacterium]
MKIIYLDKENEDYENFIKNHPFGSINQSFIWGKFQEKIPKRKFYCLAVLDDQNKIIASALLIKYKIFFNKNYLYSVFGPVYDFKNKKVSQILFNEIDKIAKKEKSISCKIGPNIPLESIDKNSLNSLQILKDYFKKYKFYSSYEQQQQPLDVLILDLTQSEKEIFNQMKHKGRYNIRLAQKKGVKIYSSVNLENDLNIFYNLIKETAEKNNFFCYSKEYYKKMIKTLNEKNLIRIFIAKLNDQPLATAIIVFYGSKVIYYYGGSSNKNREVMAPYLLHWEIIKEAKKRNCKTYDFWGVIPEPWQDEKNQWKVNLGNKILNFKTEQEAKKYCLEKHQFKGITQFKEKFGGKRISYPGIFEKIYQPFWFYFFKYGKILKQKNIKT